MIEAESTDAPDGIPYGYCHCGCGQRTRIARYTDRKRGVKAGEPVRYLRNHRSRMFTVPREREIAAEFAAGATMVALAAREGCTTATIVNVLDRQGVPLRRAKPVPEQGQLEIATGRRPVPRETRYGYCECGCGRKTRLVKLTDHRTGAVKGEPRRYLAGHVLRSNLRRFTEAEEMRMVRLYGGGDGTYRLSRTFKCSKTTVANILRRRGVELREAGPRVVPTRRLDAHGYIRIKIDRGDPFVGMCAGSDYRVPEHRLVMARHLGRPLTQHETVHHVNGIRDDNRIENLQLRVGNHGKGRALRCACCGSTDIRTEEIA